MQDETNGFAQLTARVRARHLFEAYDAKGQLVAGQPGKEFPVQVCKAGLLHHPHQGDKLVCQRPLHRDSTQDALVAPLGVSQCSVSDAAVQDCLAALHSHVCLLTACDVGLRAQDAQGRPCGAVVSGRPALPCQSPM